MSMNNNKRKRGFQLGQTVKLYKRVQKQLNSRSDVGHSIRVNLGNKIIELGPGFDNPNFDNGTLAGAITAGVAALASSYVPVGADTEVVNVEETGKGMKYTVNVDAPLEAQARFRAMIESGSGYASFLTDQFDMGEPKAVRKRPARDTWQMDITVLEPDTPQKDQLGPGIANFGIIR